MTTPCLVCGREPGKVNSIFTECSHIDCPHRGRAWSDRPAPKDFFKGPWPKNIESDPVPLDIAIGGLK